MGKTKVICFANNKGGSGKSTTCANVGYGLTQLGKKVLLIDGDMQLNLSLSLFDEDKVLAFAQSDKNLYEGIRKQADLTDYIVKSDFENLDLIPSSTLMSSIEYELFTKWQREYILKKGISKIVEKELYDYILIDAPPTLGGWVMNILCAFGRGDNSGRIYTLGIIRIRKYVRIFRRGQTNCTGFTNRRRADYKSRYKKELF